ncbi:MAG: ComEC/Rec2 family competence protein [Bryobacteraceae bacterium]
MKDPLVVPAAAVAAGILVSRFVTFRQSELLAAVAALAALSVLALVRKSRILAGACCGLGFFFAGALTALVHAPGPPPELDAEGREVVILGGCVVEPPAVSGERERFVLELEPHARAQVTLYTREGESLPVLRYGQNVEIDARVRKPRNFGNPGAFDYARYLARQDIYWTASGAAGTVRILPGRCGSPFQGFVMNLRASALDRIARLYRGSEYDTGMMQAILIGQSYQLQRIWTDDYRSTGTFHALVISGTHVAILAAFFLFLLRLCFVPESAALAITAGAAWLYALITGWHAPAVRAAGGLTLLMACGYFYRKRRALNLLAAVALGFLAFDPEQLFDASFQLTFLAVGFLGAFAVPLIQATTGPLAGGLRDLADTGRDPYLPPRVAEFRVEMRLLAETLRCWLGVPARAARPLITLPARVALFACEIAAISAVIQLGLALPMVVYFHRVGLSGLSANIFVVPLLGVAVPLGFIAVFTGWIWGAKLAGALLWLSQKVVYWHARMEPDWRIPTPPLWLGVALSAALIAAALARGRRLHTAAIAAVAALLALLLWSPFPPDTTPGQLEMTAIDVGQGDSIFLALPSGKLMLMDGGGIPAFPGQPPARLDIGEDVVAPYLWERGIKRLDVVAASHGHEDHIGGLPALLADFHPKELWTGAEPDSPAWRAVRAAAERNGVKIIAMQARRRFAFGGAGIEVLAPLAGYVPSDTAKNDDSLVLRVSYGRNAFLLTGDAERPTERWMLDENEIQRTDALKVAHHGSRTSSTEQFLDAVSPAFAVISVGFENIYGSPNREVLDRLRAHGAMVLRTDQDGLVSIRSDGRRLFVETNAQTAPGAALQPAW